MVLGITVALVTLVSGVAYYFGIAAAAGWRAVPDDHWTFLVRNAGITFVVTALALRYFYVTHEWRHNVELQARARVHALQARIRPHFLFNSMNTIAALTRSNPARAEEAVQDLADLFRANLNEKRNQIALAEEIDVARTYQRMEQLRLGDRLRVDWKVDSLPADALVPGLTLQPLLENAIYHGIEPRPDGGVVTVTGEFNKGMITIVVRNPVPPANLTVRDGNRLALANIKERLDLMYGERATVKAGRFDEEYIVTLRFPFTATPVAGRMSLRVLIVDDEPPARERLRSMLAEVGEFEVAGEAGNGEQALDMVDKLHARHRAARRAHARHRRARGGAPSRRAAGAAGGDLHHRVRRIRAAGVRLRGRGLSVEADSRREAARRAGQGRTRCHAAAAAAGGDRHARTARIARTSAFAAATASS